jgi:Putative lumazine-binding
MRCRCLGVAVLILATHHHAVAQARPAPDREQVLAVVHRLFDGMRHGDSAMIRSTLHSDAMLATAVVRLGKAGLERDTVENWLRAVAAPHDSVWDERLSGEVVHQDGTLAVIWADYRFYVGTRFNHCGVDVFTLAKVGEEWKILAIADTRRRQPC